MADSRIEQKLSVSITNPATPWRNDVLLNTPVLKLPPDQSSHCPQQSGANSNITLVWGAVSGATQYIVQWCENTSFQGPTLRSYKTSSTSYELPLGPSGIMMGEQINWRVMAFDESGGASHKTKSWSLTYDCPARSASGKGDSKTGGPLGNPNDQAKCGDFDIAMGLIGEDKAFCCDKITTFLNLVWACQDEQGRDLLQLDAIDWSITQNPADPNNTIVASNNQMAEIQVACVESQAFHIIATATFTDLVSGGVFQCQVKKLISVDCENPPGNRPWHQVQVVYAGEGAIHYMDPTYWRPTRAPDGMFTIPVDLWGDLYGDPDIMNPPQITGESGTEDAGPAGTIDLVHVTAMGPVTHIGTTQVPGPEVPESVCARNVGLGDIQGDIFEAATHLAFGCGLKKYSNRVIIDNAHLAGEVGQRRGLATYGPCSLQVNYGYGLTIEDEVIRVNYGCGLEINASDELAIDNDTLAGDGLTTSGECSLAVDPGCGLEINGASGEVDVITSPLTTSSTFLAVEDGTLDLAIDGSTLTVSLTVREKQLKKNACGVIIGPLVDGSQTVLSDSVELPAGGGSGYAYNVLDCYWNCIEINA